jgi:glutathione S-transferase
MGLGPAFEFPGIPGHKLFNEMGEIPVLEENGARLTQTAPILLNLAERYGRFRGETAGEKFEVLRWLFWDNPS